MKIVHPCFEQHIVIGKGVINLLIIEDQNMFYMLTDELVRQCHGENGSFILSNDSQSLPMKSNIEVIIDPFNIDYNQRHLLNSIRTKLIETAVGEELYSLTKALISKIESYLIELTEHFNLPIASLEVSEFNVETIIKNAGISIGMEYNTLSEKLIDYMTLVRELLGINIFALVNMKTFMDKLELAELYEMSIYRELHIVLLENLERSEKHEAERQILIDTDFCEI